MGLFVGGALLVVHVLPSSRLMQHKNFHGRESEECGLGGVGVADSIAPANRPCTSTPGCRVLEDSDDITLPICLAATEDEKEQYIQHMASPYLRHPDHQHT